MFETFEELVRYAQTQGATHVTFSNYHSGGFWKYGVIPVHETRALILSILEDVLGEDFYDRKSLTHIAHFHDNFHNFRQWDITEFDTVSGIKLDSQFIPIEQAVDYYRAWNKYHK